MQIQILDEQIEQRQKVIDRSQLQLEKMDELVINQSEETSWFSSSSQRAITERNNQKQERLLLEKTIDENITNEGGRFEKIDDDKIKRYLNLHLKFTSEKSIFNLDEIDSNSNDTSIDVLEFINLIENQKDNKLFSLYLISVKPYWFY